MTRILLIAPEPFFQARGTPMNVRQMCRVLTGGGYRVDLATYPIGRELEIDGLEIHRCLRVPGIRDVPPGFSLGKVVLDFFLFWTVLGLLLRRRYAVVHAVEESVFLGLPLTFFGVRLVYDLDSLISDQLAYTGVLRRRRLLAGVRALERLALRRSTAAITVCRALSDAARTLSPSTPIFQVEDAPSPESLRSPDPRRVEALRDELGLAGRRVVLYTGNLESYQGVDLLVEAAGILAGHHPDLRVVIVGGRGERLETLRRRLAATGLGDTVITTGHRPPDEIPEWQELADVLVSPRTEGDNTPLKIYGYMHAGKPIVATDRLTHTQVLDEDSAFLCAPGAAELAATIERALTDADEAGRRAANAFRLARERFSPEAFEERLLAAYRRILDRPACDDSVTTER